jgi:hypothetical protein
MAVSGNGFKYVAAYGQQAASGDTNITRVYDIPTNSWSFGAAAPLPARAEPAYGDTGSGGNIYAVGGRPVAVAGNLLERYNIAGNAWTTMANMPTARAAAGAAVVGNYLYVIGGRSTDAPCAGLELDVVERYHIPSNTWSAPLAPLPSPRSDFAAVATPGTSPKIYVFGGCQSAVAIEDVDVYDPATDSWSTAPPDLPAGPRALMAASRPGNTINVVGGRDAFAALTGIHEVFNYSTNTWSSAAPMLTPRGETGAYSNGGRMYVPGGGRPAFGSGSAANEVFRR